MSTENHARTDGEPLIREVRMEDSGLILYDPDSEEASPRWSGSRRSSLDPHRVSYVGVRSPTLRTPNNRERMLVIKEAEFRRLGSFDVGNTATPGATFQEEV